jgi:hypothetical protein
VDAHRIGEAGALTAQLGGFPVHVVHKVLNRPVHRHGQDVAGVGIGGQKGHVQQLLHGEHLAQLDAAIDVGVGHILHTGFPGGDGGAQGQLAVLDGLQHQQGGHDLGDAGGVGLFVGFHIIEDLAVVGVQQDGVGTEQVQVLLIRNRGGGGGGQRQRQSEQKEQGKNSIFFHRKFSICML